MFKKLISFGIIGLSFLAMGDLVYAGLWTKEKKTGEAYVAYGTFGNEYYEDSKVRVAENYDKSLAAALSSSGGTVTENNLVIDPITINRLKFEIKENGELSGEGEYGHLRWKYSYWIERGGGGGGGGSSSDAMRLLVFNGSARGDKLSGKVKIGWQSYDYDTGEMGESYAGDFGNDWEAERVGSVIKGRIKNATGRGEVYDGDWTFEVVIGASVPGEDVLTVEEEEEKIKRVALVDINGKKITNGKAMIRYGDGTTEIMEIKNGVIEYDENKLKDGHITIKDEDNSDKSIVIGRGVSAKVVMATEDEWKEYLESQLKEYARIMNGGEEVDLEEHFKINYEADSPQYKPPGYDWFRLLGVKDKIDFSVEKLANTGDVDTAIHEAVGHAFTETLGEGNKLKHAGYEHSDPWQPAYGKRMKFSPLRLFKDDIYRLSDEKALGNSFSEGWAQYVGDKVQRGIVDVSDEESQYTVEKAVAGMNKSKGGPSGILYAGDEDYGAKVENTVATFFNELYKGKSTEEVMEAYVDIRENYKKDHYGKPPQNIHQFIAGALKESKTDEERLKIKKLMVDLSIAKGSPFTSGEMKILNQE